MKRRKRKKIKNLNERERERERERVRERSIMEVSSIIEYILLYNQSAEEENPSFWSFLT